MEIQNLSIEIPMAEWKNDIQDYMAVYPVVLHELAEAAVSSKNDDTAAWYLKCLKYNLPGSTKQLFGAVTARIFKSLIKEDPEKLKLAHYLGWCVELFHSTVYVSDDVLDQGTKRRGQLCWYKLQEASATVPNDVLMMESGIYVLLRKHFRHLDCYGDLLELFQKLSFQGFRGQLLDHLISKKNVSTFNMNSYSALVMDKTACHSLYLPAALALHLAGVKDQQIFQQCRTILTGIAHFCQVENDFVDCFANSDITGKIGTDIEDNKCSWLSVVCMERANPEQKQVMVDCYGQNDPEKVARVKQLYEEMNIPSIYKEYKRETYQHFKLLIEQTPDALPKELFLNLLKFVVNDAVFKK